MTSEKSNGSKKPAQKAQESQKTKAAKASKSEENKPEVTEEAAKAPGKEAVAPEATPEVAEVVSHAEEIKMLNEKVLRAMAEAENTRRRAAREIADARAYSITGFAREMLTVQDNLRRALTHLPEEMKNTSEYTAFVEGVEVTERELLNIFDRHGIKMVSPQGEEYDHNLHQAIFEVETEEHKPGTIVQVVQEGYVIRDRLLRPAMVGVAKAPSPSKKKPDEKEKE